MKPFNPYPQNDLPAGQNQSNLTPGFSLGFSVTQKPPVSGPGSAGSVPDAASRLIEALGTYNVQGRTFTVFAGLEAALLMPGNPRRVGFSIQNISGNTVYVGIGTPPQLQGLIFTNGIQILANGYYTYESTYVPTNDIFVLGTLAGQQLTVVELTKI